MKKTIEEILSMQKAEARRTHKNEESRLQIACVRWFRLQYPRLAGLLFSVPNGAKRSRVTGAILKAEGALPGVSDLILLYPSNGCPYLCIEMKTEIGRQSEAQKEFQKAVQDAGGRYELVRTFESFVSLIKDYLNGAVVQGLQ